MQKSLAAHLAAINSGVVTKTNMFGIRRAINALEKGERWGGSWTAKMPAWQDVDALREALDDKRPLVEGELHTSGLKQLRDKRYRARFTQAQRDIIASAFVRFRLVGFDMVGRGGMYAVPVYRCEDASTGDGFRFRNIPWQQAFTDSTMTSGPEVTTHER